MTAGLSVEQLIAALQRKSVPLPFEIGAFLVLEVSERVVADPMLVSSAELRISGEGELVMPARSAAARPSPRETCKALAGLLGELLVCSAQSVPPMLLRLVEPGASDGPSNVAELRDELEANLVPLNRSAMRRVLARLVREAKRDLEEGRPRLSVHPHPVDQEEELDVILGGGRRAAEPGRPRRQPSDRVSGWDAGTVEDDNAELDAVLAGLDRKQAPAKQPPPSSTQHRNNEPAAALQAAEPAGEPQRTVASIASDPDEHAPAPPLAAPLLRAQSHASRPTLALGDQGDALDRFEEAANEGRSLGGRVGWIALLLVAVLAGGYVMLGRERTRSLVGLEPAAAPSAPPAPVRAAVAPHGTLHVTSTPPRAQVLLRVGKGPALATKLPVGLVHEFVAMRAGFAPSRATVPADAQWQTENGERRYELALQLRETSYANKEDELGSARLPAALGTPSGALGSVRVVTSPPGADVYQLIGFTPDVNVENLSIDEALELLVYLPDYEPKHVTLGRADWKAQSGSQSAEVHVTLLRRAGGHERK